MNFQQKSVLKLSIVAALSAGADSALAALDLTATTKTPVYFAKEIPVATTLSLANAAAVVPLATGVDVTTMPLTIKLASIPSYAINTSNTFFVKLSLTNGAKFSAATTGTVGYCNTAVANAGTDLSSGTPLSISLGAGTNNVTLNAAPPAGNSAVLASTTAFSTCFVQFSAITVSGNGDVNISADVLYTDASVQQTKSVSATFISFKRGNEVSVSGAGANAVIDVTTGSKLLATAGVDKAAVKVSTKTALVGFITYATATTAALNTGGSAFSGAGFVAGGSLTTGVYSVTISGPTVANAKSAYVSDTATCATTIAASATPASASVTVSGVSAGGISGGVFACLGFDGTTPISDGQITLSVANLGAESTLANPDFTTTSSNSYKFTKNGAAVKINFLTNPTGFQSFVRFTNPTSTNGNIFIDVYNDDGVKGATTVTVPLGAGKSLMYPTSQLVTSSGVVAATSVQPTGALAPNKYRLIINADFDTLNAQALSLSKDGQNFGQLADK